MTLINDAARKESIVKQIRVKKHEEEHYKNIIKKIKKK